MGRTEDGQLGGICGYAKTEYEERVEDRFKRSQSDDRRIISSSGKLYKPPEVERPQVRTPRNRLRKSIRFPSTTALNTSSDSSILFCLQFDPYSHDTDPRRFLGVYSSIDDVTLGAVKHGAYSFSREGLLHGSEYLSPTGRIRIIALAIVRSGTKVSVPERTKKANGELVRLDIPHPMSGEDKEKSQPETAEEGVSKVEVFLAVRQALTNASCIGIYSEKSLAWGACLKDKSMCAQTQTLSEEARSIVKHNMPIVTAKLSESGRYMWSVEGHVVNS